MLTYNTQLKHLKLPEYGRNIHQMVEHCLTIEDRDERTRCAHSIINCMSKLFPKLREEENYQQKLWDHLTIMSDFRLDIDYPTEVVKAENLNTVPQKIPYTSEHIRYRHYGKDVERLIAKAMSAWNPEKSEASLYCLLPTNMKKAATCCKFRWRG